MDDEPGGLLLELTCALSAPRERVFRLLTDADELSRWWGPEGFTVPETELHLEVGGSYRFSMKPPEGDLFHLAGEYLEIDPPRRLVYTFRWDEPTPDDRDTVVTLSIEAIGDTTEISLSQGLFATAERLALHRSGWTDSFEKLRKIAEQGG